RLVLPAPLSPMMATPSRGKWSSSSAKLRNCRSRSSRHTSEVEATVISERKYTSRARARLAGFELCSSLFEEGAHALVHVFRGGEQAKRLGFVGKTRGER